MEVQQTEMQTTENMPKKKKKRFLKPLIVISTSALIVSGGYLGYTKYQEHKEKQLQKYATNLKGTAEIMISTSTIAEDMLNQYHDVWSDAIFEDVAYVNGERIWGDFNEAISAQHEAFVEDGSIKAIENGEEAVKMLMKKINNPPEQYKEEYEVVVDMYKVFDEYVGLAKSPEGSLQSFSEQARELSSELISLYKELEVKMPE
jgi:hypothetical protein